MARVRSVAGGWLPLSGIAPEPIVGASLAIARHRFRVAGAYSSLAPSWPLPTEPSAHYHREQRHNDLNDCITGFSDSGLAKAS